MGAGGGAQGVGLFTNLLGGALQAEAAQRSSMEMEQQYYNQMQKQAYNRGYGSYFAQQNAAASGSEPAQREIVAGSQKRQAMYRQAEAVPYDTAGSKQSGPQQKRNQNQQALQGQMQGNLGGYSDWSLNQAIRNIQTQNQLNRISNFAQGEAGVFPYQMYDAQHAGDSLAFAGQMVSSIGGAASNMYNAYTMPQGQSQKPNVGTY